MLEVEGLDWPGDKVVAANEFLFVLLVLLILLSDLFVFEFVGGGGETEGEDGGRLF